MGWTIMRLWNRDHDAEVTTAVEVEEAAGHTGKWLTPITDYRVRIARWDRPVYATRDGAQAAIDAARKTKP